MARRICGDLDRSTRGSRTSSNLININAGNDMSTRALAPRCISLALMNTQSIRNKTADFVEYVSETNLIYSLNQFCWKGCHILPCFCFPHLPPFQCWISMDFSSAVLSGKHSTLKRRGGGPANRQRLSYDGIFRQDE